MSKPIIINKQAINQGESKLVNLHSYALPSKTIVNIPAYVFRSEVPGPTILFSGGMHGDETNGIEIVRNLIKKKEVRKPLKGSIICIPIVNVIAFIHGSREFPDGRDLNRCFPGSRSGSWGSRMAYDFMKEIISQIDFGVDFHTGGDRINNYPQIRCTFEDKESMRLAKLFAPPFILNSPYRDKTLRKEAFKLGKQILVYEAGESLRFNKVAITEGVTGCLRLLSKLKMIGDISTSPEKTIILNSTHWVRAKTSGLFRTTKKYGSFIEKDQVIGTIADPYDEIEIELKASEDGFIIGINNQPVVNEGDALMHIGVEK
jgi:predicted deacylase